MAFTVVPMRRNSPFTGCPSISSAIFWVRSPSATAMGTRGPPAAGLPGARRRWRLDEFCDVGLDRVDPRSPAAAHLAERGALGHAAFAADHALEADDLGGERLVAGDDRIEGASDVAHHTRTAGERQPDGEIAALRRLQGAEKLAKPLVGGLVVTVPVVSVAALLPRLLFPRNRGMHGIVGCGHGLTP